MNDVSRRFLRYVTYSTQSDEFCENCPSTPDSKVQVWVVPTNEELMIAQDTAELVNAAK